MIITQGKVLKGTRDFVISSPSGSYPNTALIEIAHTSDVNAPVCSIKANMLDQLIIRKVGGLVTILVMNDKDILQSIDGKLINAIRDELGTLLNRETITIRITKGQSIPDHPSLVVLSPTGDYEDDALIECAKASSPNTTYCAFHAGFIDRGAKYYVTK